MAVMRRAAVKNGVDRRADEKTAICVISKTVSPGAATAARLAALPTPPRLHISGAGCERTTSLTMFMIGANCSDKSKGLKK